MCALTPSPILQNIGWPLDNFLTHQHNILFKDTLYSSSVEPPHLHQIELDRCGSFNTNSSSGGGGGDQNMVKKLYHNASERDRRKKINHLYSSLRSLLPPSPSDQSKKLSIPATVSRVLRYIPEIQQQVDNLTHKKEELLLKFNKYEQGDLNNRSHKRRKCFIGRTLSVTASRLSDIEVVIQISAIKVHKIPLSEMLADLEEDGLVLLNASSFESSSGRVFHNLHLQVDRSYQLECEVLSEKLLSAYEKWMFCIEGSTE